MQKMLWIWCQNCSLILNNSGFLGFSNFYQRSSSSIFAYFAMASFRFGEWSTPAREINAENCTWRSLSLEDFCKKNMVARTSKHSITANIKVMKGQGVDMPDRSTSPDKLNTSFPDIIFSLTFFHHGICSILTQVPSFPRDKAGQRVILKQ